MDMMKPSLAKGEGKQRVWDTRREEVETVVDRLGMPIDEGIKDTVVAFLVNGFETRGSCEGHIDYEEEKTVRFRNPYVEIGKEAPSTRFVGEDAIKQKFAEKFGVLKEEVEDFDKHSDVAKAYWKYIAQENVEETEEFKKLRSEVDALQERVSQLLQEYYGDKQRDVLESLAVIPIGPGIDFRVSFQDIAPRDFSEEELKSKLSMRQTGMRGFGVFLKERFFNSESAE